MACVELVGFMNEEALSDDERNEWLEQIIELSVANARLEAQLEAAEGHLELMGEVCEVREENAEMRARLELFEHLDVHAILQHKSTNDPPL